MSIFNDCIVCAVKDYSKDRDKNIHYDDSKIIYIKTGVINFKDGRKIKSWILN